jgi:hypothetical protein
VDLLCGCPFLLENVVSIAIAAMLGLAADPTLIMEGILREQLFNSLLLDYLAAAAPTRAAVLVGR